MQRDESSLGATRDRARNVESCREFCATGKEKRFYRRKRTFDAADEDTKVLHACERYRFHSAGDLSLNGEKMVLHVVQNVPNLTALKFELFGYFCLAPSDEAIELVEHTKRLKNR